MRKIVIVIWFLLMVTGCKEDEKSGTAKVNKITSEEYFSATIEGIAYSFNDKVKLGSSPDLNHVINGSNKELKIRITLGLNLEKQATGTFKLDINIVLVFHSNHSIHGKELGYNWHAKESTPNSKGEITITKNNDTCLEGIFSFEGVGATKLDRSVKKSDQRKI